MALWLRGQFALPLLYLLVTLPTALLEAGKDLVDGEGSARRYAEALQHKLMQENYDYETSIKDDTLMTAGHELGGRADRVISETALNENLNKQIFDRINNQPTNPSDQPNILNHPEHQTHRSRPTINRRPIFSTYPRTSSYSAFYREPDEVLGDHDLITPLHSHSTLSQKWTAGSSNLSNAMDHKPYQKDHHDDFTEVKKVFDEEARDFPRQQSNFDTDTFINRLKMQQNYEYRNNTGKTIREHWKVNRYKKPQPNHKPRSRDQSAEYRMVPMMEKTNASLPSAINGVYMPRARDNDFIIPAPVDKRGDKNRPAGSGIPEHVISKTDLLYYIDDERLAPVEAKVTKPTFHTITAIDFKGNTSNVKIGDKHYKVLKLSEQSGRRAGGLPGVGVRTFIQEEGEEGITIVKVDNEPFPEFRLPSGRRQYMHGSDPKDSSEESGLVDD